LQVFGIENISVKGISSVRKINKSCIWFRAIFGSFSQKNCEVRKKDINFPISKEYTDEKNKNEKAENVATHFNSSRQ